MERADDILLRMRKIKISGISKDEYDEVIALWEASVRATHHFLQEEDIRYYKPLIRNHYLDAVQLYAARDTSGHIVGFMGISDDNIEMLFVHPSMRSKGIGKYLVTYAISELKIKRVDVNEQNEQAVGFYRKMGFETISRSELDNQSKPYPILHMKLTM